jgi:hypothetical protein
VLWRSQEVNDSKNKRRSNDPNWQHSTHDDSKTVIGLFLWQTTLPLRPQGDIDGLMPRHLAWLKRHYRDGSSSLGREVLKFP